MNELIMPHTQISEPASSRRLLANLSLAIDKSLVRKIDSLSDEVRRIEYLPEQTGKVQYLKKEISNLEAQLSDVRAQAL